MQENKNLVEEALIQMKNVEEAITENAKGILASTMKEEIGQLVKESLSEQDEIDVDAEVDDVDIENDADNEIEVDSDSSIEDVLHSVAGLAAADAMMAGTGYQRLMSRWRLVQGFEQAS